VLLENIIAVCSELLQPDSVPGEHRQRVLWGFVAALSGAGCGFAWQPVSHVPGREGLRSLGFRCGKSLSSYSGSEQSWFLGSGSQHLLRGVCAPAQLLSAAPLELRAQIPCGVQLGV